MNATHWVFAVVGYAVTVLTVLAFILAVFDSYMGKRRSRIIREVKEVYKDRIRAGLFYFANDPVAYGLLEDVANGEDMAFVIQRHRHRKETHEVAQ